MDDWIETHVLLLDCLALSLIYFINKKLVDQNDEAVVEIIVWKIINQKILALEH